MIDLLLIIAALALVAVPVCLGALFAKSARQKRQIAALRAELQSIRQEVRDLCADSRSAGGAAASAMFEAAPEAENGAAPSARQSPVPGPAEAQEHAASPAHGVKDQGAPDETSPQALVTRSFPVESHGAALEANAETALGDARADLSAQAEHAPPRRHAPPDLPPAPPGPLSAALAVVWGWLKANPLLYAGLCVFLVGIAFTLSYLEQHGYFSLETRLALVGVAGLAMLGTGWLLRPRNGLYGVSLMGGGSVVLYFVLFMAGRLGLLPAASALWIMLALVLAVALLSLAADAQVLAVLSTVGGFMAPILMSTGSANYLGLFGYYALLSLGNAFLLRYKAWDIPALISFAAVYGIGGLWGALRYEPSMFLHIELFLLFFFALFSIMHLQLARHADALDAVRASSEPGALQPPVPPLARNAAGAGNSGRIPAPGDEGFSFEEENEEAEANACGPGAPPTARPAMAAGARRYLHASLLFGLPLLTFAYQYRLAQPHAYLAAFSALGLAVWHVGLARLLRDCPGTALRLTRETLLILGLGFSALAVPLALDVTWTSCTWTVQGLGLVWLGLRQERPLTRCLGYLLQLLAAVTFAGLFQTPENLPLPGMPIGNRFVCGLLLTLAALALVRLCGQYRDRLTRKERTLTTAWQIWAMLWWLVTGFDALSARFDAQSPLFANAALIFVSLSCALWAWAGAKLRWRVFAASGHLLLPAVLISQWRLLPQLAALLIWPLRFTQPGTILAWESGGALALPLACAAFAFCLPRAPGTWNKKYKTAALNGMLLFALGALTLEAAHRLWGILPLIGASRALLLLTMLTSAWLYLLGRAPFADRLPVTAGHGVKACRAWSGLALSLWLGCWFAQFCVLAGQAAPLPYIPLLAPLDMAQALCLLTALYWLRAMRGHERFPTETLLARVYRGFGIAGFALCTVIAARAVSWYTYCPYAWKPLLRSSVFQGVLSLLWGSIALLVILAASRIFRRRSLWLAGAGLLALTLLKLLLFDLADRDTVYRVVSFLFLGLLMLGLGYFCPLPPKAEQRPSEAREDQKPARNACPDIR